MAILFVDFPMKNMVISRSLGWSHRQVIEMRVPDVAGTWESWGQAGRKGPQRESRSFWYYTWLTNMVN